ncbi:MAG: type transport system permease protein [Nocardioidaceae bacterium]|jgi:ABC-2 type transport system permease protein|nr:type transport system permease protein [Nocardioidaceae bacterium]MDX6309647.1 type transport system permease protein [Nocardioidaceae bacterium]
MTGTARSGTRRPSASLDGRPGLAGMCWQRLVIELKQFFREREAVVFIFAFPVVMLVIFASAFASQTQFVSGGGASVGAAQYYLTGMVSTGIMLTSFQGLATFIAVERDDGTLKRLRGTPMPPLVYFVGKIAQVAFTTVIQLILLLSVAHIAYGVDLPRSGPLWLRFVWLVLLGSAAGTVLGIAFSSVPRSGRSAGAVVTPIVIVLQFISGVYFTYGNLPQWMHAVASVFPLKWMAQGMRSVFLPPQLVAAEPGHSWQIGTGAVVLSVWLVAGLFLAVRSFRWTRRDDG